MDSPFVQLLHPPLQVSLSSLEKALHAYSLSSCEKGFDMKTVPAAPVEAERKAAQPEGEICLFVCL